MNGLKLKPNYSKKCFQNTSGEKTKIRNTYIDNEKEKHLQDIAAALRKVDHLDMMVKMEEKEKGKKETSRLPPAQVSHLCHTLL